MGLLKVKSEEVEIYAIARSMDDFPDLSADLDKELSGRWAPMAMKDSEAAIRAGVAADLELTIVAISARDEADLPGAVRVVQAARDHGLKVLLIVKEDVSPLALRQLQKAGTDDFLVYPMAEGELTQSIMQLRSMMKENPSAPKRGPRKRNGLVIPVYAISGGVGATTFAVNLAWELSLLTKKTDKRVCILDFNFQYGSVSTYLDLTRREAIYDLISDPESIDHNSLASALTSYKTRLAVLTAPMDTLPLDIIAPEDVAKLIETAQAAYDFVIIDMPQALVHWFDTVLKMSETFFAVMEVDMRSAQNCLRFLRALKAEDLPYEKVQFSLNRAPGGMDFNGKARAKRLAESLGVEINVMLPDGGKAVGQSCDEGLPLAESAAKNPLRREIKNIADSIFQAVIDSKAAVAQ